MDKNVYCCWYIDTGFQWHLRHIFTTLEQADEWYKGLEDPNGGSIDVWTLDN